MIKRIDPISCYEAVIVRFRRNQSSVNCTKMSSCESESSVDSFSSISVSEDDLPTEYEGLAANELPAHSDDTGGHAAGLCDDDPPADEAFTREFRRECAERQARLAVLKDRFEVKVDISQWCHCGHCSLAFLESSEECSCCMEIQACKNTLRSEIVLEDIGGDYTCITDHPGFAGVCLHKWSIRMAAPSFKTRDYVSYWQKGSENKFLRSVSYRIFTKMVYGRLGKKRIPLPACTYSAIRRQFPEKKFTGFKDNVEKHSS